MPLRLLEASLPYDTLDDLNAIADKIDAIGLRISGTPDHGAVAHILIDAHNVEALTDLLMSKFGEAKGFRMLLLPVEATVPEVEPEEKEEGDEPDEMRFGFARISREELYEDISEAARLSGVFAVMVALSTVVAAVGLLRGDIAIIIGAMVIAPLLGPNIGLSLAATLGDLELARRALLAIAAGVGVVAGVSLLLGVILSVDPSAPELASRASPDLADIALALAAGVAGTLAFTSGVPAVVVGVMVAVALLPPLAVAGLLAGAGHFSLAAGAGMLALTNVACINLAAITTFMLQKVSPRTWWDADRATRATRRAVVGWVLLLALLALLILWADPN